MHHTIAYARMLSEAEDRTDDDVEIAAMITGRLLRIYEEFEAVAEEEEDRPILSRLRHVRRRRDQRWHLRPAARS